MKAAFDCMGTLKGPDQDKVLKLFFGLERLGYEMVVWSSDWGLAVRTVEELKLDAEPMSKYSVKEARELGHDLFDVCIDDDSSQDWLASKLFISVHELPDDIETYTLALHKVLTAANNVPGLNSGLEYQ